MKKIEEIISLIKDRPVMYIGRNSIFCLRAYLSGVLWENNLISNPTLINEFQIYIEKKYNINTSHSWADIIHFFSPDENKALESFFIDFDEFLKFKTDI